MSAVRSRGRTRAAARPATPADIPVAVELAPPVHQALGAHRVAELEEQLDAELASLLGEQSIAADLATSVRPSPGGRVVQVRVRGRLLPYPAELSVRVWSLEAPPDAPGLASPAASDPLGALRTGWPQRYLDEAGADGQAVLQEYIRRLVVEVLRANPGCAFGAEQASAYLGGRLQPVVVERARCVLGKLLDLGASLVNQGLVLQLLVDTAGLPAEDAAEECFAELRASRVEVHLHPDDLRALEAGSSRVEAPGEPAHESGQSLHHRLYALEDSLSRTLGLLIPDLVPLPSTELERGMAAVKVNDRARCPLRLSGPEGGSFEDLLLASVEAEIAEVAPWLMGTHDVDTHLEVLKTAFPRLVALVEPRFGPPDLARVLRALLRECVSVRDLPSILMRLARFDTVPADPCLDDVFDERVAWPGPLPESPSRWPLHLQFVRAGMIGYLSHQVAGGRDSVHVLALEPSAENAAMRAFTHPAKPGAPWLNPAQAQALRDSVWAHRARQPDTPRIDAILTSAAARLPVREAVAAELPQLPVIARSELLPDVQVKVAGMLSMA